jgi:ribosomal protein L12E/L44/L45/RPP1/RPP2
MLPALAQGFTQRDFINLKDLENDVLKLGEKMKPLSSAFTQTGDAEEGGRPEKEQEEKTEGTQAKEESLDKTAGGS